MMAENIEIYFANHYLKTWHPQMYIMFHDIGDAYNQAMLQYGFSNFQKNFLFRKKTI